MSFLYLFDLVDFDKNGAVCETKTCSKKQSQENFLYLVCKFNQNFLKEQKLAVPEFFKTELSDVLKEDFSSAREKVFSHCLEKVQKLQSKSDREVISQLSNMVNVEGFEFASQFKKAVNHLQLNYMLIKLAGEKFDEVERDIAENNDALRSKIFKGIISYNALSNTADNLEKGVVSFDTYKNSDNFAKNA